LVEESEYFEVWEVFMLSILMSYGIQYVWEDSLKWIKPHSSLIQSIEIINLQAIFIMVDREENRGEWEKEEIET
jgi:hypothetical protein